MKTKDIRFPHDDQFDNLRRHVIGKPYLQESEETMKVLKRLVRKAADTNELIDLIIESDELKDTDVRANVIKYERPDMIWKEIRSIFGDRIIKTESDAGGVKVGNESRWNPSFTFIVPNGRGDGTTRVGIIEEQNPKFDAWKHTMMFATSVSGEFSIFSYDCGGEPVVTLKGRYGIYFYDGIVAIEKWDEIEDETE